MHKDLLNWIKACPCPDWVPDEARKARMAALGNPARKKK